MSATPACVTMPSSREEAWRYTPVDEILAQLQAAQAATATHLPRAIIDELAGPPTDHRVVFVNGAYVPDLSDQAARPRGLWCGPVSDAPDAWTGSNDRDDGFQALNRAARHDTALLIVDAGVEVDEPVHVVHVTASGDHAVMSTPRTIVAVGEGSRLGVIETYCGIGGSAVTNAATTVLAGRRADVQHVRVQSEAPAAVHVGHMRVEQEEGSRVRSLSVMVGADIARHAVDIMLKGVDARAELAGLSVPTGHQRYDHVVTVDHEASRGTSTQDFKSVVDDHARSSFSGHVIVRPGTVATDASQSSRNLLLAPTAEADARPWLEILADDVRCTHGATVGRLDDEALFYLRSRGIPMAESRALLIAAFVADAIDAVPYRSLRDRLAAIVGARIGGPAIGISERS